MGSKPSIPKTVPIGSGTASATNAPCATQPSTPGSPVATHKPGSASAVATAAVAVGTASGGGSGGGSGGTSAAAMSSPSAPRSTISPTPAVGPASPTPLSEAAGSATPASFAGAALSVSPALPPADVRRASVARSSISSLEAVRRSTSPASGSGTLVQGAGSAAADTHASQAAAPAPAPAPGWETRRSSYEQAMGRVSGDAADVRASAHSHASRSPLGTLRAAQLVAVAAAGAQRRSGGVSDPSAAAVRQSQLSGLSAAFSLSSADGGGGGGGVAAGGGGGAAGSSPHTSSVLRASVTHSLASDAHADSAEPEHADLGAAGTASVAPAADITYTDVPALGSAREEGPSGPIVGPSVPLEASDIFDQYGNVRAICVQAPQEVLLSTALLQDGLMLDGRLTAIHRIEDHVWLVAWCPHPGPYEFLVRGTEHNDLAKVAVFDEDAAVMDAVEASDETEASLTFHVHCAEDELCFAPPTPAMQIAARDFGALLLLPTDTPLQTMTNDFVLPVLAPATVVVHAELELLEEAAPAVEVHPGTPSAPEPVAPSAAVDAAAAVKVAWARYGTEADLHVRHPDAEADAGESDESSPLPPPPPHASVAQLGLGPLRPGPLSSAWVRWRRNTRRFNEMALCYATFPQAGVYRLTVALRQDLSRLGSPRGIQVIGVGDRPPSPTGAPRVNVPTLELLSATSLAQRVQSLAGADASGVVPLPPLSGGTGSLASLPHAEDGWTAVGTYTIYCSSSDTRSEPAHTFEPFASLGMYLSHHTPYRIFTDSENNCRTALMVPTSVQLACQLRRGGMVYDEGWVRVHRSLDSFEVVVDVTVPERGVYQLVVLGSGPATDGKFRQALVQEVVCESSYTCEAPAAVGELFEALGLEIDSHPYTVVTADEHNHVRISILLPPDIDIQFKAQLRSGEATLSPAWVQTSRNERDNKALFDVSLPKPGIYRLLISASAEGSPFTRVLTYYINAQSEFLAPQPVAVAPAFVAAGIQPASHPYQVVPVKEASTTVFRWLAPPHVRMKATLKDAATKLDPEQHIRIRREKDEIVLEVTLPAPPRPRPGLPLGRPAAGAIQPAFTLSLFVQSEGELSFKFLTSYILQVKTDR